MKRFLLLFSFLITVCLTAHSQTYYNAIATAYVTTTISQSVVFDSTMQQGGTFTMSVLAHNGGGRAGQSDTANVKIEFYNASGGLITSANSTYNANLPNPNAVCGNPCIDTSVPWSTLTVSKTLTATEAATIAYAKVSMYGIDGSYWAGDYGPWYRAPTLQLNGGGNLLYNPEFGPYNNITAQGWTSNPGFGACQGAWGGSNACIVNSDGVPGSSTIGLVANANGGGPDINGGTTSGTAGGYNSTMSVTNAGTGATAGAAPAGPTVTGTSKTNRVTTTTTYGTPVTTVSYVTRTVNTVDSQGFQVTHTYTDTVYTTTTPVYTTTTTTEVTTTTWSDGTTTTADGATTTSTTTTYQTGQPNVVYATTPTSTAPWLCCGASAAPFSANPINVSKVVNFTGRTTADSKVNIEQIGNQNIVEVEQSGGRNNYVNYYGNGLSNNVNIKQTMLNNTQTNYVDLQVVGNFNTVDIKQRTHNETNAFGKGVFASISGDNNILSVDQKNGGSHYAEIDLTGGNKTVNILQQGSASHMAKIQLGGYATELNLVQSGSTQQFYSIGHTCGVAAGCGRISVGQGQ